MLLIVCMCLPASEALYGVYSELYSFLTEKGGIKMLCMDENGGEKNNELYAPYIVLYLINMFCIQIWKM